MAEMNLIAQWEADAHAQGMAPITIDGYRWCLIDFQKFYGDKSILEADKLQIRAYVEACRNRGLTSRTIGQRLGALSSLFKWAQFEGIASANPVLEIRTRYLRQYKKNSSGEQHTHKIISIQEAARLVDMAVDIRDKTILILLFKTGIRRGELVSLEVDDINWPNQSITLKPTAKRTNRLVFFDGETAGYLRRWLSVREFRNRDHISALWLSSWGTKIGRQAVSDMIQAVTIKAGLHDQSSAKMEDHFSAHCCRHWFTTHLRRAGMPREFIQELRGDVRKEAIDIYDHIQEDELRASYLVHMPQLGV